MARLISLLLALGMSGVLTLAPFLLVRQMNPVQHAVLPLLLFGICGAFVHGFGFVPRATALRVAFSPAVAWSLMAICPVFLVLNR